MKKFRILMGALALAMVAAVIIACSKENEKDTAQQTAITEEVARKPIATFDNTIGEITTFVDPEALAEKLNETFFTKGTCNRYILESIAILDSMPRNKDVRGEIKITLLDTEEECSYSIWCMKSYVYKDVKEQQVDYYLDENVANGNYNIAFKNDDIYCVANIVGDSLSIHEVDPLDYACLPWVLFTCRSINCIYLCDKQGSLLHASCKPCPLQDGQCNEEGTLPTIIAIIVIIVRLLAL